MRIFGMPQDGIVKERYTSDEIAENIEELREEGIIDPEEEGTLEMIAREFYFRGLVHGHADEEKIKEVREDFGY